MKNIIKLLAFALLLNGCASVSSSIETQEGGVEKIYAYPYKKVFYAAESALNIAGQHIQWYTKESNEEKGYSYLKGGVPAVKVSIFVNRIDDGQTAVRVNCKNSAPDEFYKNYFSNLERFLKASE